MSGGLEMRWAPPGPVAARFMASTAEVQGICGPIGSGKTTAALMKHIRLARNQNPSPRRTVQGMPVRQYKVCAVRDTYRNLWRSMIPSWFKRVPRATGEFVGGENAPASHRISFAPGDGTVVEFQIDFVALGDQSAEEALGGYEPTAFLLEEAPNLNPDVFVFARGRAGRFPDMADGGPTWRGTTLTMNSPEMGNWCFEGVPDSEGDERFEGFWGALPPGFEFFQQPSGLSPQAENLTNLPEAYYQRACVGQAKWWIERFIKCKPGYSRAGLPVYPEFDDALHVAGERLEASRGRQLLIGLDAGLSPAAVFGQVTPSGQLRILAELVCEPGVGATRFGQRLAQLLAERFPEHAGGRRGRAPLIMGWADPSAAYGADKAAGERDWIKTVAGVAGITIRAAPSNNITKRTEAVRKPLMRLIDGEPGFLMSPDCTVLRKGANAGYRFKQTKAGGVTRNLSEIDKGPFSHPHDALQYLALGGGTDYDAEERRARMHSGGVQTMADNDDNPGGRFESPGGAW